MNKIRYAMHLMAVCAAALSLSVPAHAQWGSASPAVTYNMSNDYLNVDTTGGGGGTASHYDPPTMHVTATVTGGPYHAYIYSTAEARRDYFYHFAYTGSTPTVLHYTENDTLTFVVSGIYGSGTLAGTSQLQSYDKITENKKYTPSHNYVVTPSGSTWTNEAFMDAQARGSSSPPSGQEGAYNCQTDIVTTFTNIY